MGKEYLTEEELILIVIQALAKARKMKSGVRKDLKGNDAPPKVHIAIHGKGKDKGSIVHSDEDAWESGKQYALDKAEASLKHSSNEASALSKACRCNI